jgi:cysteine desulfurase
MRCYFDHNATTPPLDEALEALVHASAELFGNPSSIHAEGQEARQEVERARSHVAALLGCGPKEIVFTSGGTEADNLAVLGMGVGHVVITAIEHPAVLGACDELEQRGGTVTRVPCDGNGVVNPEDIRRALRPDTRLISVMHANNETGAIQPLREISAVAREAGVLLHSDGVQAAGRMKVDVRALDVDLYSISGHKLYAPKGIGALYAREGLSLGPMQRGGGQERGRRPGTENVPGIAALGAAAAWMVAHRDEEAARLGALRDRLERTILERIPHVTINAGAAPRTPNTANISFDGVEGEALVVALDLAGFAVSTGAACSSGAVHASHVLTAMGLSTARAKGSLRFSLGRANTEEQVDALVDALETALARLRRLSPVYPHA